MLWGIRHDKASVTFIPQYSRRPLGPRDIPDCGYISAMLNGAKRTWKLKTQHRIYGYFENSLVLLLEIHTHTHAHTLIQAYIYTHVHMCAYMHMCTNTHICTQYICTHINTHICTHNTHEHTHVHTHAHTNTHTHEILPVVWHLSTRRRHLWGC